MTALDFLIELQATPLLYFLYYLKFFNFLNIFNILYFLDTPVLYDAQVAYLNKNGRIAENA